jgi:uncharacterized metal-binding protein
MPSGRTHDRITLWSLPLVAGAAFWQTRNGNITLLVAGGFMFGGLMFGPDLDIYSRQFQRWGVFRFLWLPYQKSLRHRSFLSHGPIIGTTLRVVYLLTILTICVLVFLLIAAQFGGGVSWQGLAGNVVRSLLTHYPEFLALFIGLELGAMSHSLSDWTGSTYKRVQKQGVRALLPNGKMKKRKVTRSKRSQSKTAKSRSKKTT